MLRPLALGISATCLIIAADTAVPQASRPAPAATEVPTPEPPPRVKDGARKGAAPAPSRVNRFPSQEIAFSRLLRVEEVDLDRDGDPEVLVEGIGSAKRIPDDTLTVDFVSRQRLPFESPILAVMKRSGEEWKTLLAVHVPLRCGQSDDLSSCDQLVAFRTIRFRFDDRPQVILQILHSGETGTNETYAYRLVNGRLETTFSTSLPRVSIDVSIDPNGIMRRLAVDTFVNRELPSRYRSFTLKSFFVFGESKFRIYSENVEEPFSDRSDVELAYWGLVHQPTFATDIDRLRREKKEPPEPWTLDPVEVVRKRYPDAIRPRIGTRAPGVAVVYFDRPGGCHAHAVLYQPVREWEGEKSFWEIASLRGQKDSTPYECLEEQPLSLVR
jgi:hypothetical protein